MYRSSDVPGLKALAARRRRLPKFIAFDGIAVNGAAAGAFESIGEYYRMSHMLANNSVEK